MGYTNIFGNYNINTAFPSYMNYVFSGNLQLNWASSFVDTQAGTNNVTAQINDISGTNITIDLQDNPFLTLNGSSVVIVTIPANITLQTGNLVTIEGANDVNGISADELNVTAPITVIDSTLFSYETTGTAIGTGRGGGDAVTYELQSTITLADATLISVGQTVQFNNVGATDITIFDFSGNELAIIPPTDDSNQYILYLQNNTTQEGGWGITHLGAGTSEADASVLAGLGTIALNSQINTNFPGKTIGANYQVTSADRASILVWTGGTGIITLPAHLAGFYVAVNNEGSGVITINTPDATTIDGNNTIGINPGGSTYLIGVNANWNTLGNGIETFFQVKTITIPLTNANVNLTNQQSANLVQQYTGNISANITVFYPAAAGQWYIWNNTNGAYTVSAQLTGPTGNSVIIPQGEKVILYSDGNSIYNTPTIATNATFPDGNVGAPGINFAQQNTTGFYRINSGLTGYASAGTQGLTFGGPTPGYGLGISEGLASRYYNVANNQYVGFKAGILAGNTIWTLPLVDATAPNQIMYSDGGENLGFTTATYPLVTTTNELLYSSAANVISGLATANDGVFVTSAGGVPSIGNTLPIAVQHNITQLGTITVGIWNGTVIDVPHGGTGLATLTTAYGVVCAGTTPINPLQNAGTGVLNDILTSNGNATLSTWQNRSAVKADQITGTSTTQFVNPAVQQFHNSSTKSWLFGQINGTIFTSYNITSIVNTTGATCYVNFTVPFSNNLYTINGTIYSGVNSSYVFTVIDINTSSQIQIRTSDINDFGSNLRFFMQANGVQ